MNKLDCSTLDSQGQYEVVLRVRESKEALCRDLISRGIIIDSLTSYIIEKIELVNKETVARLMTPSVLELGLKEGGVNLSEIYQEACIRHLNTVHPQVALELLLQCGDKVKESQWFMIAMKPIIGPSDPMVLGVTRSCTQLHLGAFRANHDKLWLGFNRFFFSVED